MLIVFVLRIAFDSGLDFWTDELYTATVAGNPNLPFISVFSDPGNPPLFFIFARYWQMIFSHNETLLRLLPCIFSILTAGAIYLFVKSFSNKKFALLSSFLFGVNIYSIQASSDFRCYSLAALEAVLLSYYLFKIIKDGKNIDFIIYGILAALSFNTHYFQALFLLGCFIWGEILIKKGKLKFLYSNLIAFLTFLPYFLMTGLNKALISDTFNRFQRPEITEIINDIFLLYSNKAVVIVLLILFFVSVFKFGEKIFDKQVRKIFLFSMYSVSFLYLSAYLFSMVKPVIRDYYFIILVPFVSISISSLFFISI
ncbi:MAG: glycosyltransferase family 39 protein, partial [bacterium]|nr:glycosyltransferase family 39 protein [bacterium]